MRQSFGHYRGIDTFEEVGDVHSEPLTDLEEAAGTDPVGAGLVFLDLLVRDTERSSQLLLRHAKHRAAQSDTGTDMVIHSAAETGLANVIQNHGNLPVKMQI